MSHLWRKEVEIEVTLIATSIEAEEAQHIINHLNAMPQIRQAFWDKTQLTNLTRVCV